MKHIFYFSILFLSLQTAFSQAPFWTETFSVAPSGCGQGTLANGYNPSGMGVWTTSLTGVNQIYANTWFISAAEQGVGLGACGVGCGGSQNRTLHIGWNYLIIDPGATYLAGAGTNSDIRVQSPVINCSGKGNITLSYLHFIKGIVGSDYYDLQYSANGGATWSVIATPPPTPSGTCSPQGKWATYSITLPASANNNNNVKIGFRWQNTDPSGADPSVAIDDISLTAALSVSFTVASPLCEGNTATVTANTAPVASGYTWTSIPSGPVFGTPNASVSTINFPSSGTFVINSAVATGTDNATISQTVIVNPSPNITPAVNPSQICNGQTTTLSASGAITYVWNPGALSGSVVVDSPTITTNYTVVGTSSLGCPGIGLKSVTVTPTPNLTLTALPNSTIAAGASSTLTASGATNYTWNPSMLTGSNIVVTPSVTTTYTVTGLLGVCSNTSVITVTVVTVSGINSNVANSYNYLVFPNPASDKLFIQNKNNSSNDITVEIVDAIGKIILKQNQTFSATDNTRAINISSLKSGIYFIKIISAKDINVIRFIKE